MIRRLPAFSDCCRVGRVNLVASEQHGEVTFGGLPGSRRDGHRHSRRQENQAVTDPQGAYSFPDLADGVWTIQVEMLGFSTVQGEITAGARHAAGDVGTENVAARSDPRGSSVGRSGPNPVVTAAPAPAASRKNRNRSGRQRSRTGSRRNGPTRRRRPSDQWQRKQRRQLAHSRCSRPSATTATAGDRFTTAAWESSWTIPFGTRVSFPSPARTRPNRLTTISPAPLISAGRCRIPHLLTNGPNFFVGYQWMRNRNDTIGTALMPTLAQRDGEVSPGHRLIPKSQISPQALALLALSAAELYRSRRLQLSGSAGGRQPSGQPAIPFEPEHRSQESGLRQIRISEHAPG